MLWSIAKLVTFVTIFLMRNPENLESPNPSERRPRSNVMRLARALGATAIWGAGAIVTDTFATH